ncbi:4-[[4-(2-aminoethyl)phenoxy]-methyl]-2-furanmethanamine-glutamate synthase [uncultured archaeon]|nr:4-[[4-(2-aminoethyl)phenoxy]-methyl]-2-furanmethanamine-glutamate synthase [uncultured archaeon]
MILGLDIGGANTKAASSDGLYAKSVYLPLWKNAPLDGVLTGFAALAPEAVAAVITGELADCFSSKRAGIEKLTAAVRRAFSCPVYFRGAGGFDWSDPMEIAAANWAASAALLAREVGDCLFVDMGSTTTDLIPIKGAPLAAKTDFQRLARGELVYMGLLRTRLDALLPVAQIRGLRLPLSPELFAIIADARLAQGHISIDRYACETPDGAGKDQASALRRLARSVCADLEEIGEAGALAIARQACSRQKRILVSAIERQAEKNGLERVAAAGIGEDLISEASEFLGMECVPLSEMYGPRISDIFPAYAAARLLEMHPDFGKRQ